MIPCTIRKTGVLFSDDCPEQVKARAMYNLLKNRRAVVPLCDRPFVTPIHELVRGWWFPFFGFVPTVKIVQFVRKWLI